MDLLELAARCEAAEGPDRELDARIAVAVYSDVDHADQRDNTHARFPSCSDDCAPGTYWISAFSGLSLRTAEPFTASVDDALALIPDGMILRQYMATRHVPHGCAVGLDWAHGGWIGESDHSFALALCAAALRARAAQ